MCFLSHPRFHICDCEPSATATIHHALEVCLFYHMTKIAFLLDVLLPFGTASPEIPPNCGSKISLSLLLGNLVCVARRQTYGLPGAVYFQLSTMLGLVRDLRRWSAPLSPTPLNFGSNAPYAFMYKTAHTPPLSRERYGSLCIARLSIAKPLDRQLNGCALVTSCGILAISTLVLATLQVEAPPNPELP